MAAEAYGNENETFPGMLDGLAEMKGSIIWRRKQMAWSNEYPIAFSIAYALSKAMLCFRSEIYRENLPISYQWRKISIFMNWYGYTHCETTPRIHLLTRWQNFYGETDQDRMHLQS
jgi:hypothetical protein